LRRARSPAAAPLPAYRLYGEPDSAGRGELLHVESIAQRSRLHDWEIRPHRHENLFQILVIRTGRVLALLDGREVALDGSSVITVPALAAHGFRFSEDVDGLVFTIVAQQVQRLTAEDAAWHEAVWQLRALALRADAPALHDAAAALRDELQGHAPWRHLAVDAGLRRLLLALARSAPGAALPPGAAAPPALRHVQRLRELVDAQYRQQPGVVALAAQLDITPTQLNRVCRQVLGHSALGVLHARLLLEAQRDLAYTTMSIKQIGLALGFSDAGYFTRFFQRGAGVTPSAWRAGAAGADR
jgi:AraC family transcriptional regulator, transcriptional activator of pobA